MLTAVRNWVIRTMMKAKGETGIVKTLPKKEIVEMNTQITAQRLMQNGVNPESLKNADQVENAIMAIERRNETMSIGEARGSGIKSADVFDLKGRKIKDTDNIIGGEELPPPGSRGGPDDIAAPVQSSEETIKNMIEAENRKNISKMRNRKMVDDAIDNVSPGFSGDTKIDAELVAEDLAERMGLVYDDLPTKQRLDLYDQAYTGLSKQRFKGMKKPKDDPEDMAQGGRAGFSKGSAFKTIFNFLNKNNPVQAYQKYLKSVKTRAQENPKALVPELAAIASGGIFVNRRMQDILKNMKEKDMENNLENFKEELNKDPFYQKYPDIKDKVLENYTEKMFGEKRADGGRIGYFMGGPNPKGLGLLREILKYMSKTGKELDKFQGADLSALDMLKFSNPKRLNKLLEDARGKVNVKEGIMGTDSVKAMQQADREKRKGLTEKSLDVAKDMKAREDAIRRRVAEKAEYTIIPKVKKQLMESMGMSEKEAEKAARNMAESAQNIRLTDDPPIITKEGLLQLENVLKNLETGGKKKRELNAIGGRIGLKDGMDRRTFMKIMAGLTALPVLGKFFKGAKVASKAAPIIKTPNAPGKPEWFDALVTKVVNEGTDVTKGFATKERELVHTKQINDFAEVTVYRDLDTNTTIVNYGSKLRKDPTKPYERGNIQRAVNDPDQIDLVVKGAEDVEPTIIENERGFVRRRGTKTNAEFEAYESEPRVVNYDGDIEFDGTNVVNNVDDLNEDVSVLKEYATGKKLSAKEAAKAKKKQEDYQKFLEDPVEQANYLENKYGPGPEPDDFASGGIARMLGE